MPDYNVLIDYEDEDPITSLPASEVEKGFYTNQKSKPLVEITVDPGYELEMVDPRDKLILDKLRERFFDRRDEPIRYYDLKAATYKIGNDMLVAISDFQILHTLRNLWRAGYITRYIVGRRVIKKTGRGEWYGVHYKLYPKEKDGI